MDRRAAPASTLERRPRLNLSSTSRPASILPNVSVWEFNETRKRLVAQIGDKPDMATIMASMERQRLLEQDAQNAKKRHRSRLWNS